MNQKLLNEIVRLFYQDTSQRGIALALGISRGRVERALAKHAKAREEGSLSPELPRPPQQRKSKLDVFEVRMGELLERYPDITAQRVFEELQIEGFHGRYTIVRDRVRELRPSPAQDPVTRFETAPGRQAQMDYSPYTIDFVSEGTRTVNAFSYVLGYSRRQYLQFVETREQTTTMREHASAFKRFDGLAAICLYDSDKGVVDRWEDDLPIYNVRFLAFATHYGFKPWACKRRRSQTKGKVERPFRYVETSLLNGRTFHSLEHLIEVKDWWLDNRSDVRELKEFGKERPIDRFEREKGHLLPLPAAAFDAAEVVYRTVDTEGYVAWDTNRYSVPLAHIGDLLPVRITESDLVVYNHHLDEVAHHALRPRSSEPEKTTDPAHRRDTRRARDHELLKGCFVELGPVPARFFDQLVVHHRYGREQARKILRLLEIYHKRDLIAALEHATEYRAWRLSAVERILAARAQPRTLTETLGRQASQQLEDRLREPRVNPRPTGAYSHLVTDSSADLEDSDDDAATTEDEPRSR
ncbi:MAG: IS21 family transposase [Candidatus Thermoplasmatota archaeon]